MTEIDRLLVGFTHALRSSGVAVSTDRARTYLHAVSLLDAGHLAMVRASGRATLCACPEDLARHDAVFTAWFRPEGNPQVSPTDSSSVTSAPFGRDEDSGTGEDAEELATSASDLEFLRKRDVAVMDADQRSQLDAMIRTLQPRLPTRRTVRRESCRRGEIDVYRTLRQQLRSHGELTELRRRRRKTRDRRVVLIVDVSASMRPYADALLRFAHVLTSRARSRGSVEVFTLGTRLTRVTAQFSTADPHRAVEQAGEHIPDWAGGTRLGDSLRAFINSSRSLARGAVVVILSDGWERGSTDALAAQVECLQRLAHKLIWINPHSGKQGYQPVQRGIVALLPYVDELVAGHSLATFTEALEVIADA